MFDAPSHRPDFEVIKTGPRIRGLQIVDLTPSLIPIVMNAETLQAPIAPAGNIPNKIGVDDVLQITVFETGVGLFLGRRRRRPDDRLRQRHRHHAAAGHGRFRWGDCDPLRRAGSRRRGLRGRSSRIHREYPGEEQVRFAAEVAVTLMNSLGNTVFVSGDVKDPGRYPLTQTPERLLDAVTLAGNGVHLPTTRS